jgi:hypothetical protein
MKIKHKGPSQQASNGTHNAVCADVVDVGVKPTKFGPKPKLKIVYLIEERDQVGQPIRVDDYYNASIHEKAKLYGTVKTLTGTYPKVDAAGEFDTDSMIGRQCQIKTAQRVTSKGTFANITDITPPPKGAPRVAIPLDFVRAKDRPQQV